MIKKINVEVSSPERLDLYMSRVFDSVSRSKWQKLIKEGKITVDGKMVPVKFHVEQGMTIEIGVDLDAKQEPITPPPLPAILYQNPHLLFFN